MAHIPANMRMIENSYQTAARLAVQLQDELQYLKQRPINGDPAYDNAVRLIEQCLADVNGPKDILESPGQSTPAAGAYVGPGRPPPKRRRLGDAAAAAPASFASHPHV